MHSNIKKEKEKREREHKWLQDTIAMKK